MEETDNLIPSSLPTVSIENKTETGFICFVAGSEFTGYDETQCYFANFILWLYDIHFNYICVGLLLIIVLISLFGGIKEHYRWFILNQALWDLAITYAYITDTLVLNYFYQRTDLSYTSSELIYIQSFVKNIINTNPYTSLLLLSFTRFLCLYFMDFYEKLTRKQRIFYFIIIYNFVIIFVHIENGFGYLSLIRDMTLFGTCADSEDFKRSKDFDMKACKNLEGDFIYQSLSKLELAFKLIVYLKPFICLALSIVAAVFIMLRILKRFKFQLQSQRRAFFASLRILIVILFQTFINMALLGIEVLKNYADILVRIFGISSAGKGISCRELAATQEESINPCIEIELPNWIEGELGLTDFRMFPTIRQFRIFLESIVVLSIMTGYREAIVEVAKIVFRTFKNPRNSFDKFLIFLNGKTRVLPY